MKGILLAAGHGAGDSGAVGYFNGKQIKEADLARELVSMMVTALAKYNVKVGVYPTNRNPYYDWQNKVLDANAHYDQYDYFFEVHLNAYIPDVHGDDNIKGAEIWLSDKEQGDSVERDILSKLSSIGFKTTRGIKPTNDLAVLCHTKNWYINNKQNGSSALIEVGFIDDVDDMKFFFNNKQKIADAIVAGIVKGFGLKAKQTAPVQSAATPSTTQQTFVKGQSIELIKVVDKYYRADTAIAHIECKGQYQPGKYYVFNVVNGAINITKTKGEPGGWISDLSAVASSLSDYGIGAVVNMSSSFKVASSSANAQKGLFAVNYEAGTYTVKNKVNGMLLLANTKHNSGGWVNPRNY